MEIYMYAISSLSIVLGFFALIKQKTYIDADTKQPTEVEVPILGKLKTNYPALVFVFLGFAASIFAFNKSYDVGTDIYYIHGTFHPDSTCAGRKVDYRNAQFTWEPRNVGVPAFDLQGRSFVVEVKVRKGKSFEDDIDAISIDLDSGFASRIDTRAQFKSLQRGEKDKMLQNITSRTGRTYDIPVSCQ
jgi:hypothetical protein